MRQRLESYTKLTASFHQVSCGDMPISVSSFYREVCLSLREQLCTSHSACITMKKTQFETQGRRDNSVGGRRSTGRRGVGLDLVQGRKRDVVECDMVFGGCIIWCCMFCSQHGQFRDAYFAKLDPITRVMKQWIISQTISFTQRRVNYKKRCHQNYFRNPSILLNTQH